MLGQVRMREMHKKLFRGTEDVTKHAMKLQSGMIQSKLLKFKQRNRTLGASGIQGFRIFSFYFRCMSVPQFDLCENST